MSWTLWVPRIPDVAGINRQLLGKSASYSPLPLASAFASVWAAFSVCAALYGKARDERAAGRAESELQHGPQGGEAEACVAIEVPLASALLDTLVHNSIDAGLPPRYASRRERALRSDGECMCANAVELLELTDPFYSHYTCADGRPLYLVAPAHLAHQQRALRVLGVDPAAAALPVASPYAASEGRGGEEAPVTHGLGAGQVGDDVAPRLRKLLSRAFLKRSSVE